jgi:agmatinase
MRIVKISMGFAWGDSAYDEADVVVLGVPDESGSHSSRRGTKLAPEAIRRVSNEREVFEREAKTLALPQVCHLDLKICDYGNIEKDNVAEVVEKIRRDGKVPVTLGGDHSITAEVLRGFDSIGGVSVIYFDAHPDFICSAENYYGSVVCDISKYGNIDFSQSVEVGIRAPEPEELINLRREHLLTLYSFDVTELGVKGVLRKVKSRIEDKAYLSLDMDVLDPAYAPGVGSPVPGGLSSSEVIYLLKKLSKNLVGFDIMETNPLYDIQDMTSHLASRIIVETVSCMGVRK